MGLIFLFVFKKMTTNRQEFRSFNFFLADICIETSIGPGDIGYTMTVEPEGAASAILVRTLKLQMHCYGVIHL